MSSEVLFLIVIPLVLAMVLFALFRFWAARATAEGPWTVVVLFLLIACIAFLIGFTPSALPSGARGSSFGETVGGAIGHGVAEGIRRVLAVAAGLFLTFCAAVMGLGIRAGSRLRARKQTERT